MTILLARWILTLERDAVFNLGSLKSRFGTGCSNTKTVCWAYHWSITLTTLSGVGRQLIRTRRLELKLCGHAEICGCVLTCVGPQNCNSSLINNQVVDSFPGMLYFCSLCVCRQKPWKSFVIIPEMQSVLFSLEALFFVLITDIRQLHPFLKRLRENEPWHLILRTSLSVTEWSVVIVTGLNLGWWPQLCLYSFPSFGLHNKGSTVFSTDIHYWITTQILATVLNFNHRMNVHFKLL